MPRIKRIVQTAEGRVNWDRLIVLALVAVLGGGETSGLLNILPREPAAPAADPFMLTEEQRWGRIVSDLEAIGILLPPGSPVEAVAYRRAYAADKICDVARFLHGNSPVQFASVVDDGCAALAEQWPEKQCAVCDN